MPEQTLCHPYYTPSIASQSVAWLVRLPDTKPLFLSKWSTQKNSSLNMREYAPLPYTGYDICNWCLEKKLGCSALRSDVWHMAGAQSGREGQVRENARCTQRKGWRV